MAKSTLNETTLLKKLIDLSDRFTQLRGVFHVREQIDAFAANQLDDGAHTYQELDAFVDGCLAEKDFVAELAAKLKAIAQDLDQVKPEIHKYKSNEAIQRLYHLITLNQDDDRRKEFANVSEKVDSAMNYGFFDVEREIRQLIKQMEAKRKSFIRAQQLMGITERFTNQALQSAIRHNQIQLPLYYSAGDESEPKPFKLEALDEVNRITAELYDDPQQLQQQLAMFGIVVDAAQCDMIMASAVDLKIQKLQLILSRINDTHKAIGQLREEIEGSSDSTFILGKLREIQEKISQREDLVDDYQVLNGELVDHKSFIDSHTQLKADYRAATQRDYRLNSIYDRIMQRVAERCTPFADSLQQLFIDLQQQVQQTERAVRVINQLQQADTKIADVIIAIEAELRHDHWDTAGAQLETIQQHVQQLMAVVPTNSQLGQRLQALTLELQQCCGQFAQSKDSLNSLLDRLRINDSNDFFVEQPELLAAYQELRQIYRQFIAANTQATGNYQIISDGSPVKNFYEFLLRPTTTKLFIDYPQAMHVARAIQSCIVDDCQRLLQAPSEETPSNAKLIITTEINHAQDLPLKAIFIERWIWAAQRSYERGDMDAVELVISVLRSETIYPQVGNVQGLLSKQAKMMHEHLQAQVQYKNREISRDHIPRLYDNSYHHPVSPTLPLGYDPIVRAILNPAIRNLLNDYRFLQRLDTSRMKRLDRIIKQLNETVAKSYQQPQQELLELSQLLTELKIGVTSKQLYDIQQANRQAYGDRQVELAFAQKLHRLDDLHNRALDSYEQLKFNLPNDIAEWSSVFGGLSRTGKQAKTIYDELEQLQRVLVERKASLANKTDEDSLAEVAALDEAIHKVEMMLIPTGQVKNDSQKMLQEITQSAQQIQRQLRSVKAFLHSLPQQLVTLNQQAEAIADIQHKLQSRGQDLTEQDLYLLQAAYYSFQQLQQSFDDVQRLIERYQLHRRVGSLADEKNPTIIDTIDLHRTIYNELINTPMSQHAQQLALCADKFVGIEHIISAHASQTGQVQQWMNRAARERFQVSDDWLFQSHGMSDFSSWTLNNSGSQLVGTDDHLIVREFNDESYYGVMTNDFTTRLDSVYRAVLALTTEPQDTLLRKWLEQRHAEVREHIENECIIQPPESEKALIGKIALAQESINQFLINAATAIRPDMPLAETMKLISRKEAELVTASGRPNVIHLYVTPKFNGYGTTERFSAFQSLGKETIASPQRDVPGLVNSVQRSCGYRAANGTLQVQFVGISHSSLPTIGIVGRDAANKIKRLQGATEAVKQLLTELAQQLLQDKQPQAYADEPLEIPLSSMTLFSAINRDWHVLGGESEHQQLQETQLALRMLQNQDLYVDVTVNGESHTVKVRLDSNLMNAPANPVGFLSSTSHLQENINAEGFYQFIRNVSAYIDEHLPDMIAFGDTNTQDAVNSIATLWKQLASKKVDDSELLTKVSEINIDAKYHALYQLQQEIAEETSADAIASLQSLYQKALKELKASQTELAKLYKGHLQKQKAAYSKNKQILKALYQQVCDFVQYSDEASWQGTFAGQQLKELYQVMQLFMDCQAIYFSGKLNSTDQQHEFQTRYALLNYKIGRFVTINCKTAEDRSGRAFNRIEEFAAFARDFGFYPRYSDSKDLERLDSLAPTVLEFSVQREIAGENVPGARGLQQSDKLRANSSLSTKTDKELATTAKQVFKVSKDSKVSRSFADEQLLLKAKQQVDAGVDCDFTALDELFSQIRDITSAKTQRFWAYETKQVKQALVSACVTPEIIAQTATTLHHYFAEVQSKLSADELVQYRDKGDSAASPNIAANTEASDRLTSYVVRSIVSLEDRDLRAVKLEYWLHVADKCLKEGNFAAAKAIFFLGIHGHQIDTDERLITTISDDAQIIYAKLLSELAQHAEFYSYEQQQKQPYLPFIGTLKSTLEFSRKNSDGQDQYVRADATRRVVKVFETSQASYAAFTATDDELDTKLLDSMAAEPIGTQHEEQSRTALMDLSQQRAQQTDTSLFTITDTKLPKVTLDDLVVKYEAILQQLQTEHLQQSDLLTKSEPLATIKARMESTNVDAMLLQPISNITAYDQCTAMVAELQQLNRELKALYRLTNDNVYRFNARLGVVTEALANYQIDAKNTPRIASFVQLHQQFIALNESYTSGEFADDIKALRRELEQHMQSIEAWQEALNEQLGQADSRYADKEYRVAAERTQKFLNPALRRVVLANASLVQQLSHSDLAEVEVIMFNHVPPRTIADLEKQLASMSLTGLSEVELQTILDGNVYLDRVSQLENSALHQLILAHPEKTDLSHLREGDIALLNDPRRSEAALALLQEKRIVDMDYSMQVKVREGYRHLGLSQQFVNQHVRQMIANDWRIGELGDIDQSDIEAINFATKTPMESGEFKTVLARIIGTDECFEHGDMSFAVDVPSPIEKILAENHRMIILNHIKLPALRNYLIANNARLHSRDMQVMSPDTADAIARLNELRSFRTMNHLDLTDRLAAIVEGSVDDMSLLKDCQHQAEVMLSMKKWLAEPTTEVTTLESLSTQTDVNERLWKEAVTLAQHIHADKALSGSDVIKNIYSLSTTANQLGLLESKLLNAIRETHELHQRLQESRREYAADLSDEQIEELAHEASLEPAQVLAFRRQQLGTIDQRLAQLTAIRDQQAQAIRDYKKDVQSVYSKLYRQAVIIAKYFDEAIYDVDGQKISTGPLFAPHLRDMDTAEKSRHYASLAAILLSSLNYLLDTQRKNNFAPSIDAGVMQVLQQLAAIAQVKIQGAIYEDKQVAQPSSQAALSSGLFSAAPAAAANTKAAQFSLADPAGVRKGSSVSILSGHSTLRELGIITSFDELMASYQKFDLQCSEQSVKYFSKQSPVHWDQLRESRFVFDAISALISQRSDENLAAPVIISGKDDALVSKAYAVVKALGLEVISNVQETSDIRLMIAKFSGYEKVKTFKQLLHEQSADGAALEMKQAEAQQPPVMVVS